MSIYAISFNPGTPTPAVWLTTTIQKLTSKIEDGYEIESDEENPGGFIVRFSDPEAERNVIGHLQTRLRRSGITQLVKLRSLLDTNPAEYEG